MLLYIHIKRILIWTIVTFLFGIVVSLAFLFSRDLTLNTVKINDFKIYHSFLNKMDTYNNKEIVTHFNVLLSYKKYPLLPIAIITENQCIENVLPYYDKRFDLSICKIFDFNILNSSNDLTIDKYFQNDIVEFQNKHFIYKKLDKSNSWLIARIKDYYKLNNFDRFVEYITDEREGLSWLSSFKSFKKFIKKSQFIWITIVPFSLLLFILYSIYYLRQTKKFKDLNKEKDKYLLEWNMLNNKTKELTSEQVELEKELKAKLALDDINKSLSDEIIKLETKNKELTSEIKNNIKQLKIMETKENDISNKLNKASKKLTNNEQEKILDDSLNRLNQIDLLWKYKPTWQERHEIENIVSLRDEFTPFTISQAFICFEKIIENMVIKEDDVFKNIPLVDQINLIFDRGLLPSIFENDMHSIRKARNKWFHSGKQPDKQTYDVLLDILDKTNTQPLL
ncbi:MAG: hypothetical protein U9N59_14865 [Campylobacterota bacterium]|nr:hypothetical protein [Campylobacterota bacterium]